MTREKNRERREGDIRDREDREKYNFCLKGHALQKLVFLPVLPVLAVCSRFCGRFCGHFFYGKEKMATSLFLLPYMLLYYVAVSVAVSLFL